MTHDKYKELCEIFDRILLKNSTPQFIANIYLHILNAHPDFLAKYNLTKKVKFWLLIKSNLVILIRIYQSIFNRKHYYTQLEDVKSDVLFVSHLANNCQLKQEEDVYFGSLSNQLLEHNISSSIALINHTKINNKQAILGWKNSSVKRFVLSPSLDFLSEIKLYLSQKKAKKQTKKILKTQKIDQNIKKDILRHCLSFDTINSIRIAQQIASIVKKTGVDYVITTYEGHSWERLVYSEVRKINPKIKCFGYQHAAVFEHQHALKRLLNSAYNPDIIFTAGAISQNILSNNKQLKEVSITCLGSPKHLISRPIQSALSQYCLVIPEGFISESLCLFELSLAYAQQHIGQIFVWRLHPLLSFKILKKHSKIFNNLPDNIILSEQTLESDIRRCDSVLYRGSTAVVNAINAGLKPIYYQYNAGELSIDPIYQQQQGKFIVHNQDELKKAFNQNIDIKTKHSLQSFAQDFYTPLDVEVLLRELKV